MLVRITQQFAILIITISVYVAGIRNGGTTNEMSPNSYYESSFNMPNNFITSQPLTESSHSMNAARQTNEFRPSQIIEFTTSDAMAPHTYPPSYIGLNYAASTANIQTAYDMNKQFTFPSEQQQQHRQETLAPAATAITANTYNKYQTDAQSSVPATLQSMPILSYRDPYTNENYQYTPTTPREDDYYQYQQQPQEYTVHSMLLVGSNKQNYEQSNRGPYQRPGLVFDEQLSPSYDRPIYAQQTTQPYRQHPNQLPTYTGRPTPLTQRPTHQYHKKPEQQKLSYDSHDYPPPSYYQYPQKQQQQQKQQKQQQQRPIHFQSPQRQDNANYVPTYATSPPSSTSSSNYANNFGNYLQGENFAGNYVHPTPPTYAGTSAIGAVRPPNSFNTQTSPSNYYGYQIGEIPPQQQSGHNYPNYRPTAPQPHYQPYPQQPPQQTNGLASLASLLTTTQQYAPQFTNLLLGGGGGSTSAGNPLGSLIGAFTGAPANSFAGGGGSGLATRPLNTQLIRALENIARNDDLQCVPKVLCQMIAGQTQRGQLPSFVTSPAITNFLAGFPAFSPALIYGRAALLGISGGDKSCTRTYEKCPKNEYEILHYLNNHRGGFFKFFSEPEEQPTVADTQTSSGSTGGGGSLFSILSALAGNPIPTTTTTTPRPRPKPTMPSLDITSGIGNFFTQVLSDYLGGVEYQRRRRRRSTDFDLPVDSSQEESSDTDFEDFHDDEDEEDTQSGPESETEIETQFDDAEGRILHKEILGLDQPKFFPEVDSHTENNDIKNIIEKYNNEKAERKLKFPSATTERQYENVRKEKKLGVETDDNNENDYDSKKIVFDDSDKDQITENTHITKNYGHTRNERIIFPDQHKREIRTGRIINRPSYAGNYNNYVRSQDDNDKFVISNSHRQPYYQTSTSHLTKESYASSHSSSSSSSYNTNSLYHRYPNHNYENSNYSYLNDNYVTNNRYGSNYQGIRTTRSPYTATTTSKHEDNKNIYITNGQGVTEYFITPDGRKVYL
ncbi:uncharacterized protein LOC119673027 [Teleopsis dalmanni]|uniref:uncharacterized protein LOC119673027 n=1 Tax=Teleopsis dalmanni TaxID=139649 RepID=UPI0018CD7A4F|nr:uncharacterized protein LOC119673027 [Teleopsis dalmanni]